MSQDLMSYEESARHTKVLGQDTSYFWIVRPICFKPLVINLTLSRSSNIIFTCEAMNCVIKPGQGPIHLTDSISID